MRTRNSVPSHSEPQPSLQAMRQQVVSAATASVDMEKLYLCWMMLSEKQRPRESKYSCQTDEELERDLEGLPSLEDRDYSYLDGIDYGKCKPVASSSVANIMQKWL